MTQIVTERVIESDREDNRARVVEKQRECVAQRVRKME